MKFLVSLLFFVALQLNVFAQESDYKVDEEIWMVIKLKGKRIGYSHEVTSNRTTEEGEEWKTAHYQKFKIQRLDSEIEIESQSIVIEDGEGVVLNFENKMQGSGTNIFVNGHRENDFMVLDSDGKKYPIPREVMGPAALDRKVRSMPLEPGSQYNTQAFSLNFPNKVADVGVEVKGEEMRVVEGNMHQLWRVDTVSSLIPGVVTSTWVDGNFKPKYMQVPFPGLGEMEMIVTTEEDAMRPLEGAEIFAQTLIKPNRPLPGLKNLKKAVYRLKLSSPGKYPLWSENEQVIVSAKRGEAEISVTMPEFSEPDIHRRLPYTGEKDMEQFLKATPSLEIEDTRIIELAKQAVGQEKHPLRAARKIEHFVNQYIKKKDLSAGFASAAETARTATGDCTENAVLAAALGRVVGLPTRIVVGLAYLDDGLGQQGVFGFHMWAEAWLDGTHWYPMDSALHGFDVGHIAITKMSLEGSNPLMEITLPVMQMTESLKVEVVSTEE